MAPDHCGQEERSEGSGSGTAVLVTCVTPHLCAQPVVQKEAGTPLSAKGGLSNVGTTSIAFSWDSVRAGFGGLASHVIVMDETWFFEKN